jgi:membrane fusion protein, multidrug efflux system
LFQEKNVTSVWIVENGAVKLVPVQIGGVSGNDLLIASGVSEGQKIVTAGVHLLKPQQRVTILEDAVVETNTAPYLSAQTLLKSPEDIKKTPVKSGTEK